MKFERGVYTMKFERGVNTMKFDTWCIHNEI